MIKRLLAALGIDRTTNAPANGAGSYKPYAESHVNFFYNLLFCDDISLFKNENTAKADGPWPTVLADKPDLEELRRIADDETAEGRVRALAFNRLRAAGQSVPPKRILGVIVEVRLQNGLDTLAAFSEGGVRYLNQSGKIAVFEGAGNPVEGLGKELVSISQSLVNEIGPWDRERMPPPKAGHVRLTFLVSDGLYFGEGPFEAFQGDPLGGPVLAKATQLLQRVVEMGTSR